MAGEKQTESNKANTAFDAQKHAELLRAGGVFTLRRENRDIYIAHRHSNKKGSGFGTAVMRHVAEEALKNDGTITLQAAWSSHIFHLYMGMIPNDWEVDYVRTTYGMVRQSCLQMLQDCSENELTLRTVNTLLFILQQEKQIPDDRKLTLEYARNNSYILSSY